MYTLLRPSLTKGDHYRQESMICAVQPSTLNRAKGVRTSDGLQPKFCAAGETAWLASGITSVVVLKCGAVEPRSHARRRRQTLTAIPAFQSTVDGTLQVRCCSELVPVLLRVAVGGRPRYKEVIRAMEPPLKRDLGALALPKQQQGRDGKARVTLGAGRNGLHPGGYNAD